MTNKEKAEIILECLEEYVQVDWNFKEIYEKAIDKGLIEIAKKEKAAN
ncbi:MULTISPECIES: hypothetical protein [Heyndrickxia]|nr:hypothetical protein [Weizmannia sp. CD-2023]MED4977195.1 hypothetical protein [Weizmannia sp. CD-2023]